MHEITDISTSSNLSLKEPGAGWKMWLVVSLLLVLYAPTIYWLWGRWTMSVWHHAHGLLMPPVVAYMVWKILRRHCDLPFSASPWGFAILVPALILLALDTGIHTQLLSALSLVIALPGLALLFLGVERTKLILFPLVFMLFMLPIPLALTEPLHLALREIATTASANLLPYIGIPVYAEGTILHTPNATLLVADACSGFSTLYASVVIAMLLAYMCPVVWRRVLVVISAVPIAIAANIIRVILLTYFVETQGVDILKTSLHTVSGLFTFALAIPIIIWLGSAGPADVKQT